MSYIEYLKLPYKFRGSGKGEGTDCYTLAKLFYEKELGIFLPALDYVEDWFATDTSKMLTTYSEIGFQETSEFTYGNLLVLIECGTPRHLGVIVEDGCFLHTTAGGTACHSYVAGRWATRIYKILQHKDLK